MKCVTSGCSSTIFATAAESVVRMAMTAMRLEAAACYARQSLLEKTVSQEYSDGEFS